MKVFLGSSKESLRYLEQIATWLEDLGLEPLPWNDSTLFLPGDNTFLKLIEISTQVDAAVFIFAEDDSVWYREGTVTQPRDNVLLEYGLFVGALGPKRAIICRRGQPKAATDLHGINWVDASPNNTQRARVQLRAWAEEMTRARDNEKGDILNQERPVVQRTPSGFKSAFRNTDIYVDFGMLQNMPMDPECAAVVLPANEFFDERCFQDPRTAAGAFIGQYFPKQTHELQRLVKERLPESPIEFVERPGQRPVPSFGVATCVYLDHPAGSSLRLLFASVATDRPPEGLRTDLSTIFRVIEQIRCILAEQRIPCVFMPLLGAGKGGVAAEIAFHTLVSALLDARCRGGGHHLREAHIVVHAPQGRPPQIGPEQVEAHLRGLVSLYRNASQ